MKFHLTNFLIVALLLFLQREVFAQAVDHWETIVYNDDEWNYAIGAANIPQNWIEKDFDLSNWKTGQGGFGYGDNDDNTILPDVFSVYIRKDFIIGNKDLIGSLVLHADFDDGFVAYLNGIEIARKNLGTKGVRTNYNVEANDVVEPNLIQGLLPDVFSIDVDIVTDSTNILAIQIHNRGGNSSDLSSNFFLSAGILDDSLLFRNTPFWFEASVFDSTLPIIKITTPNDQDIMDEPRITAHMGIISNGIDKTQTPYDLFNDYDGAIAIEYRGTSSLIYEKKGYGFETRNQDGTNNNVSLLGMPEENDWVLNGPYSDKSLLRNVLSYHMGNLTGRYAPRTELCNLFINNRYEGIYVLTEKIKQDKNRVDVAKLTPEDNADDQLTGGYIIKVDRNPNNIVGAGWESSFPDFKFFAYVEPKDDQITPEQKEYIQNYMYNFEWAMSYQNFEEKYRDYIDIESFVDYFLVTEISKQIDAFKLSFYLYKDKDSKGGKLNFGPLWDFNLGYGNFDFDCSPDPEGWAYQFPQTCGSWHPFWATKLVEIPNVQHLSKCRWEELRTGPLQTESILAFINQKASQMHREIDRNFDRWPILGEYVWPNNYIGETYTEELDFLKNWLVKRLNWMDNNMLGNCDDYLANTKDKNDQNLQVFPNPATDNIIVKRSDEAPAKLSIYNMQQQLIISQTITKQNSVDTKHMIGGVYFMVVTSLKDQSLLHTQKLVVIK